MSIGGWKEGKGKVGGGFLFLMARGGGRGEKKKQSIPQPSAVSHASGRKGGRRPDVQRKGGEKGPRPFYPLQKWGKKGGGSFYTFPLRIVAMQGKKKGKRGQAVLPPSPTRPDLDKKNQELRDVFRPAWKGRKKRREKREKTETYLCSAGKRGGVKKRYYTYSILPSGRKEKKKKKGAMA